jgi:surface antigen
MLASSNNIADYVDKSSYQSSISDELQSTISTINKLKQSLETKQVDVKRVLGEQQLAKQALVEKEAEQQLVLNETKGQEAAYNTLTADREQKKGELHRQQQAAIEAAMSRGGGGFSSSVIGDSSKGGYPWESGCWLNANAWSFGGVNGNGTDPLGYGCRQCVSYTAYKVGARTGNYPRFWGNANMWPSSARSAGYQTGSTPRENSVGIIMDGQYGHSVWVESVNSDGSLIISQYNYYNAGGPGWGNYSKMRVSAATYDTFIYF